MRSEIGSLDLWIFGSLALEGLAPDTEALADLELVMQGKLTVEEAKQNVFDRIRNGKV